MNDRTIGDGNNIDGITQSNLKHQRALIRGLHIESFSKTLSFSAEATKALIYINGGAAVAMLAFCGNYIGAINSSSVVSILCFSLGAFVGIWILYAAYFAQGNFTNAKVTTGRIFNRCSICFAILAMVLFILGIVFSTLAINRLQQQKANHIEKEIKVLKK